MYLASLQAVIRERAGRGARGRGRGAARHSAARGGHRRGLRHAAATGAIYYTIT